MSTDPALHDVRCAWVTPVLGVHGRLLYFGPLLRGLASRFASFRVLTGEFAGDASAAGFPIETCGGYRKLYRDDRLTSKQTGRYVPGISIAPPTVVASLWRQPVDLVIVNEFSLFCSYAALAGRLSRRARVLLIVESRPRLNDPAPLRLARQLSRRAVAMLAHHVLTNNRSGRDYLEQELGVPAHRILARPYLVSDLGGPPAAPRRWDDGNPDRRLRLVYAGDLVRRKGPHLAIEAIGLLTPAERSRLSFELAGDGPFRPDLEAQIARLGLGDCVRLLGRQPYERMRELYDGADAFLFPTLGDYRALSPFEALSRGLAILGSVFDGGAGESVDEGRNGFTFNPERPAELTGRLRALLERPEQIEAWSLRSLELARNYTLPVALGTLAEAARLALGREPSAG